MTKNPRSLLILLAAALAAAVVGTPIAQAQAWLPSPRAKPGLAVDPRLRADIQQALLRQPSIDAVVIGQHGTPSVLRGRFGRVAASGAAAREADLAAKLPLVAPLFGFTPGNFRYSGSELDEFGGHHFRYGFELHGRRVIGASLNLHVDAAGELVLAIGILPGEIPAVASPVSRLISGLTGPARVPAGADFAYVLDDVDAPLRTAWTIAPSLPGGAGRIVDAGTGEVLASREADIGANRDREPSLTATALQLAANGGRNAPGASKGMSVPPLGREAVDRIAEHAMRHIVPRGANALIVRAATVFSASAVYPEKQSAPQSMAMAWQEAGEPQMAASFTGGNFRAVNISTRAWVGTGDQIMIAGFALTGGGGPTPILVRGIGPGLQQHGVTGWVPDPFLELFFTNNDNWSDAPNAGDIQNFSAQVGAYPLQPSSLDAAVLTWLGDGHYTGFLYGNNGATGEAVVEVFDDQDMNKSLRLLNLSTRAMLAGHSVVVSGFVIKGSTYKPLLIRAVGPTLANFGVPNTCPDPRLRVFTPDNIFLIHSVDNWSEHGETYTQKVETASQHVGAFQLPRGSLDAALYFNFDPGLYYVQVLGPPGIVLVEIYDAQ